jgi:iron(III) transport system permease protein
MSNPNTIQSSQPGKNVQLYLGPVFFILIVLGPLFALLLNLGESLLTGNPDWLALTLPQGRRLTLFLRSISLASGVAVGGLILGILAGMLMWRWRKGPLSILRWFLLVLVPVPPYIHALGWSAFFVKLNALLSSAGLPQITFRGWIASWWVQLMALAPIAIGLALIGFESIDSELIDAARISRKDFTAFKRVILPLAAPALLGGGAFLFLLSLVDYSVPSLFQVTTYPLEIFAEFSASNEPGRALLLSIPVLIIAMGAIALSQAALRNAALRPPWKSRTWENPPDWPTWLRSLQRFAVFLLVAQIMVPLISQLLLVGSFSNLVSTTEAARDEISSTMWIAALAALISTPIALPIAQRLVQKGRSLWWIVTTLPLAIPSPLIGIGLIMIWNRPATQAIYSSTVMPILAAIARFAPLAVLILFTQMRRTDPALLDAARILQKNDLHSWLRVRLPLLIPGLLGTAGIIFVLSAGELGATLLVVPPGGATLTMRIYSFLHYGASDTVAGLGLVMTLVALLFGVLAILSLAGWSRFTSKGIP